MTNYAMDCNCGFRFLFEDYRIFYNKGSKTPFVKCRICNQTLKVPQEVLDWKPSNLIYGTRDNNCGGREILEAFYKGSEPVPYRGEERGCAKQNSPNKDVEQPSLIKVKIKSKEKDEQLNLF